MMESVLVVEDRQALRQVYTEYLKNQGYRVVGCGSAEEAQSVLDQQEISAILLDYMLPRLDGLSFLRQLKKKEVDAQVILMTAFGEIKLAVQAMRVGAFDFLEKPIDLEHLGLVIKRALEHHSLKKSDAVFREQRSGDSKPIIGSSELLTRAVAMADTVAESDTTCLILGESGTGKELLARRVHERSGRREGPFVSLNCASIPRDLMESEMFGHEKGAFTGAVARKIGLVEMASGGTLFLDEIGDLSLELQPKLLRLVQEFEFRRVGGSRIQKSDVRLICATNRDLANEVREGRFREDLYFRISVFPVEMPPLRERIEDLRELVPHFLSRCGHPQRALPDSIMRFLEQYTWPGNVREVENVIERAVILSQGGDIRLDHFPDNIRRDRILMGFGLDLSKTIKENVQRLEHEVEEKMIDLVLRECGGRREPTASRLGISAKTLYNKLKARRDQGVGGS